MIFTEIILINSRLLPTKPRRVAVQQGVRQTGFTRFELRDDKIADSFSVVDFNQITKQIQL